MALDYEFGNGPDLSAPYCNGEREYAANRRAMRVNSRLALDEKASGRDWSYYARLAHDAAKYCAADYAHQLMMATHLNPPRAMRPPHLSSAL